MLGKILAMVGEDIRVKGILDELLEANRSQLEVVMPSTLIKIDQELSYVSLSLLLSRRNFTLKPKPYNPKP